MKKLALLAIAAMLMSASSTKVYICKGPKSKCYHATANCRGLRNCSTDIDVVTIDLAQKLGRRPCGFCCK